MATILFGWELGNGLGHVAPLGPLARELTRRGHKVFVALRDLRSAATVFGDAGVTLLQAPSRIYKGHPHIAAPATYGELLFNAGFGNRDELCSIFSAWRALLELVKPHLALFEHAPTGLLAAHAIGTKRIVAGSSFCCPSTVPDLPPVRPWLVNDPPQVEARRIALENANHVLRAARGPLLGRLADLYADSLGYALLSFKELDQFGPRPGMTYWGTWGMSGGATPVWPPSQGKKIFAYLKPFPALSALLEELSRGEYATLIYADGIDPALQQKFSSPRLTFSPSAVDLQAAATACDFAILNGNHGTSAAMLLAGKPILSIPLHVEHGFTTQRIVAMGAGIMAGRDQSDRVVQSVQNIVADPSFRDRAKAFADRYRAFNAAASIRGLADYLETLVTTVRSSRNVAKLASKPASSPNGFDLEPRVRISPLPQHPLDKERAARKINLIRELDSQPNNPLFRRELASLWRAEGQLVAAAEQLEAALQIDPSRADDFNSLGCVLLQTGEIQRAAAAFERAFTISPACAAAHNNLGSLLQSDGQIEAAIWHYREALRTDPYLADAHNNLGCALRVCRELEEAEAALREALQLRPTFVDALTNRGSVLQDLGRFEEALACQQKAIRLEPTRAEVHCNLGSALQRLGRFDDALRSYTEAIRLDPEQAEPRLNRSLVLLAQGNFREGWREYAWRRRCGAQPYRADDRPLWRGEPLDGKRLFIHAEQGFGDTLQFVRYLHLIRNYAAPVAFEVPRELVPLLRASGFGNLLPQGAPRPEHDLQSPLLDLPAVLNTELSTIPAVVPYLRPAAELAAQWRERLADVRGFRVGIAWQGNPNFRDDRSRSIPLAEFEPVAHVLGVRLVSLQKGPGEEQLSQLQERFNIFTLGDFDRVAGPFMDTAAVITSLDLVITSDSAVAHLAGALGAPVWLALPTASEWRWFADRDDSPWYPTMRLFRQQKAGDWRDVFLRVADALRPLAVTQANEVVRRPGTVALPPAQAATADLGVTPAVAAYRRGLALVRQNNLSAAIQAFEESLALDSESPLAWNDLGCTLSKVGRPNEAHKAFERALERDPKSADALNNLGCSWRSRGRLDAAEALLRQAIKLKPAGPDGLNNLGNVLQDQGRFDEALELHREAITRAPRYTEAHNCLGAAYQRLGDLAHAREHFDEAIRLDPGHVEAHYRRSLVWLSQGDFEHGWAEYEWRLQSKRYAKRSFEKPTWDGSPLTGRTLLVHVEQGFGDTLQFARLVKKLSPHEANVWFEVSPRLVPLLQDSGFERLVSRGGQLPRYDVHCALLSLPVLMHLKVEDLPGEVNYIAASHERVNRWRDQLAALDGFRVGIAWQGSPTFKDDRWRSIPLKEFAALAKVSGIQVVSLQKGAGEEQIDERSRDWLTVLPSPWDDAEGAFVDTAAVIESLDLVITSDTSIAHLAGAMGKPAWVVLGAMPEWRWMIERFDSPWYPSMRLYRRSRTEDWPEVFQRITEDLSATPHTRAETLRLTGSGAVG